jgi:hypothetical protein
MSANIESCFWSTTASCQIEIVSSPANRPETEKERRDDSLSALTFCGQVLRFLSAETGGPLLTSHY